MFFCAMVTPECVRCATDPRFVALFDPIVFCVDGVCANAFDSMGVLLTLVVEYVPEFVIKRQIECRNLIID